MSVERSSSLAYNCPLTFHSGLEKNMTKRLVIGCLILGGVFLSVPFTRSQQVPLRIYFVDVGQGHAALIVSPTGKTMLIDGGPDGAGDAAIVPLMESLGLDHLDVMVATHYDGDHIGGLDEVAAAFPPAIAYDSGDLTAPQNSFFFQYRNAVAPQRRQIRPGTIIDLGDGARATCIVVNGQLISGGRVGIFGRRDPLDQLDNSACIGLLIQYGGFDLFISGDLTGGGNNTTDVESIVGQLVGDVDVLQLNHHGSRTGSNPTFLNLLKAEVGIVQVGRDNPFGHPAVQVIDRFINTTPTNGVRPFPPDGDFTPNRPPFVFQTEFSPPGSSVSHQGVAARGTLLIETDGRTYTVTGGRLPRIPFPVDGAEEGIRSDFPPSIVLQTSPIVPQAGESYLVQAQIVDDGDVIAGATLRYRVNEGDEVSVPLRRVSRTDFIGVIPGQPDGALVQYDVVAEDGEGQVSSVRGGYFAGVTPIASLRRNDDWGVPEFLGYPARIIGTVTVGTGSFSRTNTDIYVEDESGGINVFELRTQSVIVDVGARVIVVGRLLPFNGVLKLDVTNPYPYAPFPSPFGVTPTDQIDDVIPRTVTLAEIDESMEGLLVRVDHVRVVDGSIPAPGQNGNLRISDGTGELTLRVLRDTDIPGMATPHRPFSIIGVVGQFDRFRPFDSGYQILPRSRQDFILSSSR
ncbi:MAG: MBL fold metallo-hydrolase [Acidobacteria bacterium]|nr:MAG: MBL fold metallo-hydrolase [Acidobacteriota bacterium]